METFELQQVNQILMTKNYKLFVPPSVPAAYWQ